MRTRRGQCHVRFIGSTVDVTRVDVRALLVGQVLRNTFGEGFEQLLERSLHVVRHLRDSCAARTFDENRLA